MEWICTFYSSQKTTIQANVWSLGTYLRVSKNCKSEKLLQFIKITTTKKTTSWNTSKVCSMWARLVRFAGCTNMKQDRLSLNHSHHQDKLADFYLLTFTEPFWLTSLTVIHTIKIPTYVKVLITLKCHMKMHLDQAV